MNFMKDIVDENKCKTRINVKRDKRYCMRKGEYDSRLILNVSLRIVGTLARNPCLSLEMAIDRP